jgi:hypothetical protein
MARFHFITNSNNLHHCFTSKIRLRVTGRAVINLNSFPFESNQLALYQIFSAAVILRTASSIGGVIKPYYFTIMLVVGHVVFLKTKKGTKKQRLVNCPEVEIKESKCERARSVFFMTFTLFNRYVPCHPYCGGW